MAINLVKTVNFGKPNTSLSNAGYRIYSSSGALSGSRTTSGVGEVLSGAGIYSASIHIADSFTGYILWDTGESSPIYASEDVDNTVNTIQMISSSMDITRQMTTGKWEILTGSSQMVFYKEDNTTEVARFNLLDASGNSSYETVFSRVKV